MLGENATPLGVVEEVPDRVKATPLPPLTGGYKKAMRPRRGEGALLFLTPCQGGVGGVDSGERVHTEAAFPVKAMRPHMGFFTTPVVDGTQNDYTFPMRQRRANRPPPDTGCPNGRNPTNR